MSSNFSKTSSQKYSPVYKVPGNHIEELNSRLRDLNGRVRISFIGSKSQEVTYGNDINPSVGSDTEKESDMNIQQLESTVSSLSGLASGSSTVNSPEAAQQRRNPTNWHIQQQETDF